VNKDGKKHNMVITSDNSREPEEERVKQGTGDLRACGPGTFFNVDSFIKHCENFPISGLDCAAVNNEKPNEIEAKGNVECTENAYENVKESVQIDLSNEKIESSTEIDSVLAEIDHNPVVVAEPFNTGDSLMNIDSLNQSKINLCQTVSCNNTSLNIGFDSGATVTLVSKKVAEMSIGKENVDYDLDTIEGQGSLKGSGAVHIPLALPGGEIHVLKALITDKPLGEVAVLPPHADVAQSFDVPKGDFAARDGGAIDIMVGRDNSHLFPQALGTSKKTVCNLQLFRAVLGKGLMYAGPAGGVLKKVAALIKTKYKVVTRSSLFSLGMVMLTGFGILAPTSGFVAYDCMNSSNTVEAYSLS
jgi:hypothetical protein